MASFDGLSEITCTETNTPIFKIVGRYIGVFSVYLLKLNLQQVWCRTVFGQQDNNLLYELFVILESLGPSDAYMRR